MAPEDEIKELERQLQIKKNALASMQRLCKHKWNATIYDPVIRESYYSPGDPPGTMGIDRQLPMWVPGHISKCWKRSCSLCKKVETITTTKFVTKPGSVPGTTCVEEVPAFPLGIN